MTDHPWWRDVPAVEPGAARRPWRIEELHVTWDDVTLGFVDRRIKQCVREHLGGRAVVINHKNVTRRGWQVVVVNASGTAVLDAVVDKTVDSYGAMEARGARRERAAQRLRRWLESSEWVSISEIADRIGVEKSALQDRTARKDWPENAWGRPDSRKKHGRWRWKAVQVWLAGEHGKATLAELRAWVAKRKALEDVRRAEERQWRRVALPAERRYRETFIEQAAWSQPEDSGRFHIGRLRTVRDRERLRPSWESERPYVLASSVRHTIGSRRWEGLSR
jgi:hypothetical protein